MMYFSGMDYWYDIIEKHDPPKIKGSKGKDHGTFSKKVSVILLMYLAFGTDYSTGITEYFRELKNQVLHCPSALTNANKIGSVLKRMNQDKLVILVKEVTVKAGTRKYYEINPQILQSPINDGTCFKPDGSIFEIPLETIEGFLELWALEHAGTIDKKQQKQLDDQLRQTRHERADEILKILFDRDWVDYASFLEFIRLLARIWDSQRASSNQKPFLEDLISCYIHLSPH